MIIRAITENDWPSILSIQANVYPDITPETETVLRSKMILGPQTCLVITDQQHNVTGYCLAHPWHRHPASLHTIYPKSQQAELLYIHDMAIAPLHAGKQIGSQTLKYLQQWAKQQGYKKLSLVSLQQAVGYWQRHGFKPQNYVIDEAQYGAGACYMLKQI
nr:GNAT family N-acetyltransferase [uncultured Tolumonas sp.]